MAELGKRGVTSVMIEGGAELAAAALEEGVVDKIFYFVAPKIVGGKRAPSPVGGKGVPTMDDALPMKKMRFAAVGDDIMIEAYVGGEEVSCLRG